MENIIQSTILVVDDDEMTRLTLQDFLEGDGFMAKLAPDGFMAARIVRHESVDLVFLDVELPGKNGIEVLKEIKLINELLPVIMLTGATDSDDIFQCALEAGAYSLIPKPVSVIQMRTTLKHALFGFQL